MKKIIETNFSLIEERISSIEQQIRSQSFEFFSSISKIEESTNSNKAGLFEGSFSWRGWGQFDPFFIFQKELI